MKDNKISDLNSNTPAHKYACADCGFEYVSHRGKCPRCGSENWFDLTLLRRRPVTSKLKLVIKNKDEFIKNTTVLQSEVAKGSGCRSRKKLIIDKNDPNVTQKYHIVEEFQDGKWVKVHEHKESFPAKRRPKCKKN